jgi:hypothetical protein
MTFLICIDFIHINERVLFNIDETHFGTNKQCFTIMDEFHSFTFVDIHPCLYRFEFTFIINFVLILQYIHKEYTCFVFIYSSMAVIVILVCFISSNVECFHGKPHALYEAHSKKTTSDWIEVISVLD